MVLRPCLYTTNVYYVTMQITFLTRKFWNGERNLHCDVVHITTKWVSSLTLDCNGVFAIKAYSTWTEMALFWSLFTGGSFLVDFLKNEILGFDENLAIVF